MKRRCKIARTADGRRVYIPLQEYEDDECTVFVGVGDPFYIDPPLDVRVEVVPGDEDELLDALADYLIALHKRRGCDE